MIVDRFISIDIKLRQEADSSLGLVFIEAREDRIDALLLLFLRKELILSYKEGSRVGGGMQ